MLLTVAAIFSSCRTRQPDDKARANIHFPAKPVEEVKNEKTSKKLPSVIEMKDRHGNKTIYAQTEKDQDGNSRLSVQLKEVTVTARMKTVPERFGKVDVDFIVSVPEELIDRRWQLNLTPNLIKGGNVSEFDDLVISGDAFREVQDKQYARYEQYLSKIIPDSLFDKHFVKTKAYNRYIRNYHRSEFIRVYKDSIDHAGYARYRSRLVERYNYFNDKMHRNRSWLKRRMSFPKIKERYEYFGRDTIHVAAAYNKRYQQIAGISPMFFMLRDFNTSHIQWKYRKEKYNSGFINDYRHLSIADSLHIKTGFLKKKAIDKNNALIKNKQQVFFKLVKFPRNTHARLDTVVYNKGKFDYYYKQELMADEDSKRINIYVDGYVVDTNQEYYLVPSSDTLNYMISSMIQLLDTTPRYLRKVIERKVMSSLKANIGFKAGASELDINLGDNLPELEKVQEMADRITGELEFVVDSITLVAGCSPEGSFATNMLLSKRRGESIRKYLTGMLEGIDNINQIVRAYPKGEDWQGLSSLVRDSLDSRTRQGVLDIIAESSDPDTKEIHIRQLYPGDYTYIRDKLYPKLRVVEFTFYMHRRGMLKDTVYTTEPDTLYAKGMELLAKRRYSDALQILSEYNDYNTAICLMSLGYDTGAYSILESIPETANREYLMAILAARMGREEEAVRRYLLSVELDPAKRWRGTLDPEINRLIKAYDLNKDDDDENNNFED
ncbi:hypothetical protein D0T57_14275 [Dysgonomonas sp. 511]|nr:hypothetical protein [Dysgonomonas sp. 511]